jgi:hypothetical protein
MISLFFSTRLARSISDTTDRSVPPLRSPCVPCLLIPISISLVPCVHFDTPIDELVTSVGLSSPSLRYFYFLPLHVLGSSDLSRVPFGTFLFRLMRGLRLRYTSQRGIWRSWPNVASSSSSFHLFQFQFQFQFQTSQGRV